MKFIVSSSALLKHLQQINGVINANTVLPILEDFLFEIEDKKLMIASNTTHIYQVGKRRFAKVTVLQNK